MRDRPRVLFDCDGPLTEGFVDLACRYIREESNGTIDARPEKVDEWDMMKALGVPADIEKRVYGRLESPDVALSFVPNDGSVEFMEDLNTWADVYIVTSPLGGPHWAYDRERWLHKWFKVPSRRVCSVKDKFIVHGDAFVDDKRSHLQEWKAEPINKDGLAILWRIAPNRHDEWPVEASNYKELVKLLEPLKRSTR